MSKTQFSPFAMLLSCTTASLNGMMLNLSIPWYISDRELELSLPIVGAYCISSAFLLFSMPPSGKITYARCESVGAFGYIIISVFGKYLCEFCMGRAIAVKRRFSRWSSFFKVTSLAYTKSDTHNSYSSPNFLHIVPLVLKLTEGWEIPATFH